MTVFKKTKMPGVIFIKPHIFRDHRGEYVETYNEAFYRRHGIRVKFIQDDISVSRKGVIRGFHGDNITYKLISCLLGKFYLVIVNCDESSPRFGEWESFILSDKDKSQVLVPPKHGVAHLALSEKIIFHYKQSSYYNPSIQFTYKWNDPRFRIQWPLKHPALSKRDRAGHYVK